MTTRLKLIRGSGSSGDSRDSHTHGGGEDRTDGFSFRFAGGQGLLRLEGERVSEWTSLENLEMVIPKISFPFDVTRGLGGLRTKRLGLARLELGVNLESAVKELERRLVATGSPLESPLVSLEPDCVSVLAACGPKKGGASVSFRLLPSTGGENRLGFIIDHVRIMGPLPMVALSLVTRVAREISGGSLEGVELVAKDPVRAALMAVLPAKGWRLPRYDHALLSRLELRPHKVEVGFSDPNLELGEVEGDQEALQRLKRVEELRIVKEGDRLLSGGRTEEARATYARLLDREADNPVVAARLAMVDVANEDLRDFALSIAEEMSQRRGFRPELDAVIAQGAALSGQRDLEEAALRRLLSGGYPLERLGAGLRLGDLLMDREPSAALEAYEAALEARREDPRAILSVLKASASCGKKEKAGRLISRWIAVHRSPAKRARAHQMVGGVLLDDLEDPAGAVKHFERAAISDPENLEIMGGLARSLAGSGDTARAIGAFERLEKRCVAAGDTVGAARCKEAVGRIWLGQGEPDLAVARFKEAVEGAGEDVPASWLMGLATGLLALDQHAEAALVMEEAFSRKTASDAGVHWGSAAMDVAEVYLGPLGDPSGAEQWIRRAMECPEVEHQAREMLAALLEKEERWGELTKLLERRLGDDQSAQNVASLARARLEAGELEASAGTLRAALDKFPERDELRDLLIRTYRAQGDLAPLAGLLKERFETVDGYEARSDLAWEIGRLELEEFQDPRSAMTWFERSLAEDPDHLGALEGVVVAAQRVGNTEEYEQRSEQLAGELFAAGRRTEAAGIFVRLARVRAKKGEIDEASGLYRRALPDLSVEQRGETLCELAKLLFSCGDHRAARDLFDAAGKEGAGSVYEAALGSASASLALEDYDRALSAATTAGSGPLELRPKAATAAAKALDSLGRREEAATVLLRVAQNISDEEAPTLMLKAVEVLSKEPNTVARRREVLEELLVIEPSNPDGREGLVALLEEAGDRGELARCLVRFAEEGERGASDLARAADFFSADGLHGEAAAALRKALELSPDTETARLLAGALKRTGAAEEMLGVLRRYAAKDPLVRTMLIEQLEELGRHGELVDVLEARVEKDETLERERLLKLAEIFAGPGADRRAAIDHLVGAMESGADAETGRRLAARAVSLAREDGDPMLLARSLEQLYSRVEAAEKPDVLLEISGAWWEAAEEAKSTEALRSAMRDAQGPLEGLAQLARDHAEGSHFVEAAVQQAVASGQWQEADLMLSVAVEAAKGGERGSLLRRRAAVRRGRLGDEEGAVSDLLEAQSLGVLQNAELEELVDLLAARGESRKAAELAMEIAGSSGKDPSKFKKAALLCEAGKDREGALSMWRKCVALNSELGAVVSLVKLLKPASDGQELARLLTLVEGKEDLLDIPDHLAVLEAGVEMELAKGEELEAVEGLAAMMTLDPSRRDPWRRMVGILERRGEWEALVKRMEERLTLSAAVDDVTATAMSLGKLLDDKLGDEEGAVAAFERVMAVDPKHPGANRALASIAFRRRSWKDLERHLKALDDTGEDQETGLWRAAAAGRLGRTQEAIDGYRRVLRTNPSNTTALEGLCKVAQGQEVDEEIVDLVSKAVGDLGPDKIRSSVHRRAAKAYMRLERLEEARRRLEHADSHSGGDFDTLDMLAELNRLEERHEDRAEVLCRLAYKVEGRERAMYLTKAAKIYLERLFDEKRAYHWLIRAADAAPDEPQVLLGLADCAWALDELEVLARSMERYRLVAPSEPLNPTRTFHFAAALERTGGWAPRDIAEMLERIIESLSPDEKDSAAELLRRLVP